MRLVQKYLKEFLRKKLVIVFTHFESVNGLDEDDCLNAFNELLTQGTLGATPFFSDQKSDEETVQKKRKQIIKHLKDWLDNEKKDRNEEHTFDVTCFTEYTENVLKEKLKEIPGSNVTVEKLSALLKLDMNSLEPIVSLKCVEKIIQEHNKKQKWCVLQ